MSGDGFWIVFNDTGHGFAEGTGTLDNEPHLPIYKRIKRSIKQDIESGKLAEAESAKGDRPEQAADAPQQSD